MEKKTLEMEKKYDKVVAIVGFLFLFFLVWFQTVTEREGKPQNDCMLNMLVNLMLHNITHYMQN